MVLENVTGTKSGDIVVNMEAQTRHNCSVCGGFDFMKENGYFYCVECQTQCEGIREQVFDEQGDDDDEERLIGTPFVKKYKRGIKKNKKKKGGDFTTWEMFNSILRAQVEELISLGASKSIRDTVLQLWAYYLQKLEVAFFSREERALPRLGSKYHLLDAKYVYGLNIGTFSNKIRSMDTSVNANLNTSRDTVLDSWTSQKINMEIKKKAKRAFMNKMGESSIEGNADTESIHSSLDQSLHVSFDDSISVSMSLPREIPFEKLERTKAAKEWLSRTGNKETANDHGPLVYSPEYLSRYKLLVLLYLALLYEGSPIQISDLLRWIHEGHLSFYDAAKHLPETCFLEGVNRSLFPVAIELITYTKFVSVSSKICTYLEVTEWPLPDVTKLAKKYVTELQLPEMVSKLVERFVALVPDAYNKWHERFVGKKILNYEAAVLAILIIILKLLFGLDGRTEHQISKVASQLNMLLQQKGSDSRSTKLFVWKDWVQQLICRRAMLAKYHFPSKQSICPESYGNPFPFIKHCKRWNDANAGFDEKYNLCDEELVRAVYPGLLNTLSSIVEKLQDPDSCENEDINFPPCSTPYSVYIKKIIEKSSHMDPPLITKPALEVLSEDFSNCDIKYLLKPKSLVNLASAHGQQLKIKNKSAQKKFKRTITKKEKAQRLYTSMVYVSCKNSPKGTKEACDANKKKMTELKVQKKTTSKKSRNKAKKSQKIKMHLGKVQKHSGKVKKHSGKVKKHSGKVKKYSKKSNDRKRIKSDVHQCGHSRKRKKDRFPSGNSKKMKLSKLLKLYVPSSAYWVHLVEEETMSEDLFETCILPKFPFAFSWLLSECAFLSSMTQMNIYKEVVRIEKLSQLLGV